MLKFHTARHRIETLNCLNTQNLNPQFRGFRKQSIPKPHQKLKCCIESLIFDSLNDFLAETPNPKPWVLPYADPRKANVPAAGKEALKAKNPGCCAL